VYSEKCKWSVSLPSNSKTQAIYQQLRHDNHQLPLKLMVDSDPVIPKQHPSRKNTDSQLQCPDKKNHRNKNV